jgi:hypothetical protein
MQLDGWGGPMEARKTIVECRQRYLESKEAGKPVVA